jgi:thioredoxin-related protein
MDANTYSDNHVSDYLLKKYVLIKLNAESQQRLTYQGKSYTERELAAAFGVTGYPTTLFLKSNGEPITSYPGYADATMFRNVISFIAEDHYLSKKFDEYCASQK